MKLAFISDLHLGFAYGTQRQEESFENAAQAFELALKEKPDLVLLGGDIFHDKIPRQEILGRAIELFTKLNNRLKKALVLRRATKTAVCKIEVDEKKELIPAVVGIWGTHERRHAQSTNPAQLLEKAGLLKLLHAESLLVEVGYERLGIHGLSGVPEDYSRDALLNWNPEPFDNAHNILLLHQNIAELIPAKSNAIRLSDLPKGFDLFLLGHFHWHYEDGHPKTGAPVLIPGSTVITQMNQKEASAEKGFFIIDLPTEKKLRTIAFRPIVTRPAHHCLLKVKEKSPADIQFLVREALGKALGFKSELKPIVKVKLKGSLARGFSSSDVGLTQIYKDYSEKAILDIDKSELASADAQAKAVLLQELKDKKISVDALGLELIMRNLPNKAEAEKLEQIFNLLAEEELEGAEKLL